MVSWPWSRDEIGDPALPKTDRGTGALDDYDYDLVPRKAGVRIRLAAAEPNADEIASVARLAADEGVELETIVAARTIEQERVDAPIEVRVFLGRRVSGIVGVVPRGLESVVDQTLRRLEDRGDNPRIPVEIVQTRRGLRVELLMGATR
ncbi:hypothetical protein [Schumannella soli]|uniref:Uncharacterized protein n=1 Tax=Schumannella soli TaxID=2590779 RepID=A0A506Y6P0_9MICO|nr:hypothetical protein [Schumannella soli]TPW76079.1 hypothetical protein FJ657_09680 [Schumannella soli]